MEDFGRIIRIYWCQSTLYADSQGLCGKGKESCSTVYKSTIHHNLIDSKMTPVQAKRLQKVNLEYQDICEKPTLP